MAGVWLLAGCVGPPLPRAAGEPPAGERLMVGTAWSRELCHERGTACQVVETATELAELRARPEGAPLGPIPLACNFAVERLVLVWFDAPGLAPPFATTVHREEDVDVMVIEPGGNGLGRRRTWLHAFVVPLRPWPLAVVVVLADSGQRVETTLAVVPGR